MQQLTTLVIALLLTPALHAQCPGWSPGFGFPGVDGSVRALATFDDGTGPALYVSGDFSAAGWDVAGRIAKWDGVRWSALPMDFEQGPVRALAVWDDGGGPALYAGGTFDHVGSASQGVVSAAHIARWDGTNWTPLGAGLDGEVDALCVYDDGSGARLYAGGAFASSGSTPVAHIARWDGNSWTALGSGTDGNVLALHAFDPGSGTQLFVGGAFANAGGVAANDVAAWDGSQWSALGPGVQANVLTLTSFTLPGNSTPTLIAGGPRLVGVTHVASWDGLSWTAVGLGPAAFGSVNALAAFDDGSGPALYAGAEATNYNGLWRWDGTTWNRLTNFGTVTIRALHVHDEGLGAGPALFVGGTFSTLNTQPFPNIARWTQGFSLLGTGWGPASGDAVLGSFDDGSGRKVYVGNQSWDGASWQPAPGLPSGIWRDALEVQDWFGTGPRLVYCGNVASAGQNFGLAVYDGSTTTLVGALGSRSEAILSIAMHDDGSGLALYAIGGFTSLDGVAASDIARFDGASWTALGSGLTGSLAGIVGYDVESFDDGSGPALYACGRFQFAGGTSTPTGVARWNGTSWSSVGTGSSALGETHFSLFDDGQGTRLYLGGDFHIMDGQPMLRIARWNGTSFESVGGGLGSNFVKDLAVFDDGSGAGARLIAATDGPTDGLSAFDGTSWSPFGGGLGSGDAFRLLVADQDGDRVPELYVKGNFDRVGDRISLGFARYEACGPVSSFCAGDGLDAHVTTACPCGNNGAAGRGCAWHNGPNGALLQASGTTSPDTLVLTASGMPNVAPTTIFLKGDALIAGGTVFGDGVRCIGGNLIRLGSKTNVNGAAQYPEPGNVPISVRGQTPVGSGLIGCYQTYYRNAASFCTSATFNVTNAVRVIW